MVRQFPFEFAVAVIRPALLVAPRTYLADINDRLSEAGLQEAVNQHNTAAIFDWLVTMASLQGINDAVALGYDAQHGGIRYEQIEAGLRSSPLCTQLGCFWSLDSCGYRKDAGTCAEPEFQPFCPLPRHALRKGSLNIAAYSLFLFFRDVCDGDFVSWVDARLEGADPGVGLPGREARMRTALLEPLSHVHGIGPKLWNMMLADLLLGGDPRRERWKTTGASMVAIDTLIHNFLHRTGILRRFGAEHAYGARCYAPKGCAEIVRALANGIDAATFNPAFPALFPRFVQHALWGFCSKSGWDICNGNRIDDRRRCENRQCPAFAKCDRVPLKGS